MSQNKTAFIIKYVLTLVAATFLFVSTAYTQMREIYANSDQTSNSLCKLSFYSPSQGFVAFSSWIGFTTDSGRTFAKKTITSDNVDYNGYNVNITFGFSIMGIKSFDHNTLIVYGDYGAIPAILSSVDGGNTYKLVFQSQINPLQVSISNGVSDMDFVPNTNTGFAVDEDRILKSTDQGLTWSIVSTSLKSYYNYVEALDVNNVFAGATYYDSPSKLQKTINGGSSWQTITLPTPTSNAKLTSVYFLTSTNGWICMLDNGAGYFYKTTNGGSSWTLLNNVQVNPFLGTKIKFIDNNVGFTVDGQNTVYKTNNGGAVWKPLQRDNNLATVGISANDLQCMGPNQIWAGWSKLKMLELSTNAGGTPLPKSYFYIDTTGLSTTGNVKLINYSGTGYTYKWLLNGVQISTAYNSSYAHNIYRTVDTVQLVVSNGINTDTSIAINYFIKAPPPPTITSFLPTTGSVGTFITINGTNFTGVTSVKIGGVAVSTFKVVSDNVITASIASGATGSVSCSNTFGVASLVGFTFFPPPTSPPPTVIGFSPQLGPVGTTVTILGNNFGTSQYRNIVYFGATRGAIISATSSQIICTVPIGASYKPISILNTETGLVTTSVKPFNVTFADSANFTTRSFVQAYQLNVIGTNNYLNTNTVDVVAKDLDGDGRPDLACLIAGNISSPNSPQLFLYKNTSSTGIISFASKQIIENVGGTGTLSGKLDFGDLDGDGKPDMVNSTNTPYITIARNSSVPDSISFDYPITISGFQGDTQDAAIADLDNDGKNDIAIVNYQGSFSIVRNTSSPGTLSFASPVSFSLTSLALGIDCGDIDGDGKKDIITFQGNGSISVFRNVTTAINNISFAPEINIPLTLEYYARPDKNIKLIDYDNDGKLDVVLFAYEGVYILLNKSTPSNVAFQPIFKYGLTYGAASGLIENFSGSAMPDMFSNAYSYLNSLVKNTSKPNNIINNKEVLIDHGGGYVAAADFNLDGKIDIVTSQGNPNSIIFYTNNVGVPINKTICVGGSTGIDADLSGLTYQWQQDSGKGFISMTDNASFRGSNTNSLYLFNVSASQNGYKYRCIVDSNYSSIFIFKVQIIQAPTISIATPNTSLCYGTPITFSVSTLNAGLLPTYKWVISNIYDAVVDTNSTTFTTSKLQNNDRVYLQLLSGENCLNYQTYKSNVISMSVTGGPQVVNITASKTIFCIGDTINFIAATTNIGTNPSYQWQINGVTVGGNSNAFQTVVPTGLILVKCILVGTSSCMGTKDTSTSNVISVSGSIPKAPSYILYATAASITKGTQVTFSVGTYYGNYYNAYYQFKLNGVNVSSYSSNTWAYFSSNLKNGDSISCTITIFLSSGCYTTYVYNTNTIVMNVIPKTVLVVSDTNYKVQAVNNTCQNKNDGKIIATIAQALGYTVKITGNSFEDSSHFNGKSYERDNLPAGIYQICFTIDSLPGYQQCFSVNITQPKDLSLYAVVVPITRMVDLTLGGSGIYDINLNGTAFQATASNLSLLLQAGFNTLSVQTPLACQGIVTRTFFMATDSIGIKLIPNPTSAMANIYLPGTDSQVKIEVLGLDGRIIEGPHIYTVGTDRSVHLNVANYINGLYIVRIKGATLNGSIKLIKSN